MKSEKSKNRRHWTETFGFYYCTFAAVFFVFALGVLHRTQYGWVLVIAILFSWCLREVLR